MLKFLGSTLVIAFTLVACGQQNVGSSVKAQDAVGSKVEKNKTASIVYGNFKLALWNEQDSCAESFLSIAPGFVAPMAILESVPSESCNKPLIEDYRAYNIVAFNLNCGGRLYEGSNESGDVVLIYDYRDSKCGEHRGIKVIETLAGSLPQTFVGESAD